MPKFSRSKRRVFLNELAETCNITHSAKAAGISRGVIYQWKEKDTEFAKALETARQMGGDALEDEAIRRAKDGWEEPVFHQGQAVGAIRKYSDTLLIFLLKGAKPEKYRERIEHSGQVDIASSILEARKRARILTDAPQPEQK